ncbi:ribbon-helix-helix domain-containing protein [Nocardia sp. XZ_19_369]|uniref:ribbon-helix-helix domain-containing protein n=1 Tax=Nocardia sp. XZ_19_369 TaxID=2769487 RepID=UPI00188E66FE|nr:ribbon-helix-helix domain-containing protein [Nocardia sp. XZ_19_369]
MPSSREPKTRKVTVTLPEELVATLESWRASGRIESVSAFVSEAVQGRISRAQSLAKLEQVLGGRPPLDLINRARAVQGLPPLSEEEAGSPHAGAA